MTRFHVSIDLLIVCLFLGVFAVVVWLLGRVLRHSWDCYGWNPLNRELPSSPLNCPPTHTLRIRRSLPRTEKRDRSDIGNLDSFKGSKFVMPRTARVAPCGLVFHLLNRGVARMQLFEKPADYQAFEQVLPRLLTNRQ